MLCDKCKKSNLVQQFDYPDEDVEVLDVNTVVEWRVKGQKKKRKFIAEVPFCAACGEGAGDLDGDSFVKGFRAAAAVLTSDKLEFSLPREADLGYFIEQGLVELKRIDYDTQRAYYRVK